MSTLAATITTIKATVGKANKEVIFDAKRVIGRLKSGCLMFDLVSNGGFPRGRLSEVFGMEHSGKSSLVAACASLVVADKGVAVLIDTETAWDPVYGKRTFHLEQDNVHFAVFQPDNIEECDEILTKLEPVVKIDALFFDSVDAMKPKALIEGALADERRVGAHAQAMSRFVAKARRFAKKKNCAIVFINQMRTNITTKTNGEQNQGTGAGFNPMETMTTTGGYTLRFYASLRIKLEYGGKIDDELAVDELSGEKGKTRVGNMIKIVNIKNKVGTPFLKGMATFMFSTTTQTGGWGNDIDTMKLLKKRGRIKQVSSRFEYHKLDGTVWTNVASMAVSEALFLSSPDLVADARAQLTKLLESGPASELLEMAAFGTEITAEDTAEPSLEEIVSMGLETDVGAPEAFTEMVNV